MTDPNAIRGIIDEMSDNTPEAGPEPPFWERKTLDELSEAEWEALCDGCGRCCMVKLEDVDTGERLDTRLACRLLDIGACRCTAYANRHVEVPDCLRLTPPSVYGLDWLPGTCAYRLRAQGRPLLWWHPLVSGDPETVHQAGISVRGFAISERKAPQHRYQEFAVARVGYRTPTRRRRKRR